MESKQELKYIFSNVNDWLKFAEAKHGGLIVLNSGIIIGILATYKDIHHCAFKPALLVGLIAFGISIGLSIISQFPVITNRIDTNVNCPNPNLYFFGHLATFDSQSFINHLIQHEQSFSPNQFDKDLINQILVNSRITNTKYQIFKYASYITAFGFGLIGITSLIKIIWHL